ncbi:uncharacterized protein [Macrobrachium rosenbergii]
MRMHLQHLLRFTRRIHARRSLRNCLCLLLVWITVYFLSFSILKNSDLSGADKNFQLQKSMESHLQSKAEAQRSSTYKLKEEQPAADKFKLTSQDGLVAQIEAELPNLAIKYWHEYKNQGLYEKNVTCAKLPYPYDINFNNKYWQVLKTSNGTFHLYSAYYDNRTLATMKPAIRLLGTIDKISPSVKTNCQLWFEGRHDPVISEVWEYKYIWNKDWGNYKNDLQQPYLMACRIPKEHHHLVPVSVSLVEKPCEKATTNLKVIYNLPLSGLKEDFAVCVKGLDFPGTDLSVRITEWLELLFLLGVSKVFMYDIEVHPNVAKVLNYYEKQGLIEVTKLTLPGELPNIAGLTHWFLKSRVVHKRQNELIPYNDCLYRNMYKYKYLALLDTDEVILPKQVLSWNDLMDTLVIKAKQNSDVTPSSYHARNVYFWDTTNHTHDWFPDIPPYMHMLQHVYRAYNYTKPGAFIKCFHDTERVITLHNHFPFACFGGCNSFPIDTEDAQLQHYRADCVSDLKKSCFREYKNHTVLDTTIWRYQKGLVRNVENTLRNLNFFG